MANVHAASDMIGVMIGSGQACMFRSQGGGATRRTTPCADYPEAIHLWNREVRACKRRGYAPVAAAPEPAPPALSI